MVDFYSNTNHNELKKWNVAAYIRLSREDEDKGENQFSNSIITQKEMIDLFLKKNENLKLFDYFIDDGFSGTDFERPNFKKMMELIYNKQIDCIIVKDLSRFGRNYIEVGNYLEQIFPIYNIRFIAINDNIDSFENPDSYNAIIVPFKNLINDEYARDISNKVKVVLNNKRKRGEYVSSRVPFGYKRDILDKYKLVIDDKAANVVRKIFSLYLEGYGMNTIANKLNKGKVLTLSKYKEKYMNNKSKSIKDKWGAEDISDILSNRTYIGEISQCKYKTISYKIHKKVRTDPTEWIITEAEPIINPDDFNKVQYIKEHKNYKSRTNSTPYLFAGFLYCEDCNSSMNRKYCGKLAKDGSDNYVFYCANYLRKKLCSKHLIHEKVLEYIVIKSIRSQINFCINVEKSKEELINKIGTDAIKENTNKEIEKVDEEIEKYNELKKQKYLSWKKSLITQEDYFKFIEEYSKEIIELNNKKSLNINKLNNANNLQLNFILQKFMKYKNIENLNRDILLDLVDKIYISEGEKIRIVFRYNNIFQEIIERQRMTENV